MYQNRVPSPEHLVHIRHRHGATIQCLGNDPEETCVASESGQNEADVTRYTGQPSYADCQSTVDGIWSGSDGVVGSHEYQLYLCTNEYIVIDIFDLCMISYSRLL